MSDLWGRARVVRAVRRFFEQRDFLEVETPLMIPAPAPEPHLLPQPAGRWFLQTSPELCMKRLLARGHAKIFQICKCFRRQERGRRHVPEFTMLEWYRAGADYLALMDDCEQLLTAVAAELALPGENGHQVSLVLPWERLTVAEAFCRYAAMEVDEALRRDLFDQLLVEKIEPHLGVGRPTFLYDYPLELAALARPKPGQPEVAERFELYLGGVELANGFSELIDPVEQRRRFEADRRLIRAAGRRPPPMPEPFLAELDAMPQAAGIALGLDRLVMIMLGKENIDQVLAFPPETL
ncbi:EF-P lysine aminoacylase EpmA [Desulfurivibrio alkaliphilus]|uniref:tRNA synthetase class II (D K and N) n=1 Tax=Desulfurivibrio alkaliphilus (strain DSM 19089 / UNIQEM U267 / AHT2) TaxID=589865 RepID=D6Z6L8_DESAT|nr:EF-P lysine aminoacylase EpmA [Desulfurivibrio alkaliphilus]ADH84977.1 tRNA synthetase class II (D K and N) [Desulfurivibrio alkaliphilus AHT 2]